VNLSQLQQLSASLVDLHQQFDTMEVAGTDFQRQVLDAFAGNAPLLAAYQAIYRQYQAEKKALEILQHQKTQFNATFDYNKFLFDELDEASLQQNELED